MADSLFLPDGEAFVPTELARGPWSPNALHGGSVAALLARAAERIASPGPMQVARMSLDLLRPVPSLPLTVVSRVLRPGKKIQVAEIVLRAGEQELARAVVLRIRSEAVALPADIPVPAAEAIAPPERLDPVRSAWFEDRYVAYHSHATEHRVARGAWAEPGPATDWIRLRYPVVPDEVPSPLVRVAAVADFGNGISTVLPFERYTFINADLTVHLDRLPVGEWVCLDAVTLVGEGGVGMAESALYDRQGRIGRAVQSLLIEPR